MLTGTRLRTRTLTQGYFRMQLVQERLYGNAGKVTPERSLAVAFLWGALENGAHCRLRVQRAPAHSPR